MANGQDAIAGALSAAQKYGAIQKAAAQASADLHQSAVNQAETAQAGQPGGTGNGQGTGT